MTEFYYQKKINGFIHSSWSEPKKIVKMTYRDESDFVGDHCVKVCELEDGTTVSVY